MAKSGRRQTRNRRHSIPLFAVRLDSPRLRCLVSRYRHGNVLARLERMKCRTQSPSTVMTRTISSAYSLTMYSVMSSHAKDVDGRASLDLVGVCTLFERRKDWLFGEPAQIHVHACDEDNICSPHEPKRSGSMPRSSEGRLARIDLLGTHVIRANLLG